MRKIVQMLMLALVLLSLGGCAKTPTPTSTAVSPSPVPTATHTPTATPIPTMTLTPTPTLVPTSTTPAPEETFVEVGSKATFQSEAHDVTGTATVAGLQTIVLRGFSYSAGCKEVDIRLGLADNFDEPAAVLVLLESRVYSDEILVLIVPNHVEPGEADSICVYCSASEEVLASGKFSF